MLSQRSKIPKRKLRGGPSQQLVPVITSHGPPVMGTQERSELVEKKRRSELDEKKRKSRESKARQDEMAKAEKAREGAT
jgi:hypothetical protein